MLAEKQKLKSSDNAENNTAVSTAAVINFQAENHCVNCTVLLASTLCQFMHDSAFTLNNISGPVGLQCSNHHLHQHCATAA